MKYPLALCSHKRIVYVPEGWFDAIGKLDSVEMKLEISISKLGEAGFEWFVDSDGKFYELTWKTKLPKSFGNFIGLKRQQEVYAISPAREITVEELNSLVKGFSNQFDEAPDSSNLQNILAQNQTDDLVGSKIMQELFSQ